MVNTLRKVLFHQKWMSGFIRKVSEIFTDKRECFGHILKYWCGRFVTL